MTHTLHHERQHAADHRWLAQRIIGWWDDWLAPVCTGNITLVAKQNNAGFDLATNLGIYAVGYTRIITSWYAAMAVSGDLFHQTTNGGFPKLKVLEIADDHLKILATVPDKASIQHQDWHKPPKPHQSMVFETKGLDGNEKLKAGAEPKNPFLDWPWIKLDATHWTRKGWA